MIPLSRCWATSTNKSKTDMAKKKKMTDEEKAKLPEAFRKNMGRFRGQSTERAREIGKKGGDAFAENVKHAKTAQEIAKAIDAMPMTAETIKEISARLGIDEDFIKNLTQGEAKALAVNKRILSTGSVKDWIEWLKIKGEYTETLKVDGLPETPVGDRLFTKKEKE